MDTLVPSRSARLPRIARIASMLIGLALVATASAPLTLAYDGTAAAAYADAHWGECDSQPPHNGTPPAPYICIVGNDCTNHASAAMHAGGYPFRYGSLSMWYYFSSGNRSYSWASAPDLYSFLTYFEPQVGNPGGTLVATIKGTRASDAYNSLSKGDLIFFDFDGNNTIDHLRMETGWWTVASPGWRSSYNAYWSDGDYADNHSPARYHDNWNAWYTTDARYVASVRILEVHISSAN